MPRRRPAAKGRSRQAGPSRSPPRPAGQSRRAERSITWVALHRCQVTRQRGASGSAPRRTSSRSTSPARAGGGRELGEPVERFPASSSSSATILAHPRAEQADAGNLPCEPRRLLVIQAQPTLVPDRPENPCRVVDERLLVQDADRLVLEVGAAAVRVDQLLKSLRATPPWRSPCSRAARVVFDRAGLDVGKRRGGGVRPRRQVTRRAASVRKADPAVPNRPCAVTSPPSGARASIAPPSTASRRRLSQSSRRSRTAPPTRDAPPRRSRNPARRRSSQARAIASISTRAPDGSADTSSVARAGGTSPT